MKRLKYIILIILPILLLSSKCADKNKTPNVLRGRIMYNCTTPASNVAVSLKANADGANKDIIETTTDENGYFELSFIPKASTYRLYAPYKIMGQIPSKPELDLGVIVKDWKPNYYLRLQVNNPHTINDTLVCFGLTLPGPFQSGIIDTIYAGMLNEQMLNFGETPTWYFGYSIVPYVSGTGKFCYMNSEFCNEGLVEALLIID